MIAFDNMSVTFGQLISYAIGAGFETKANGRPTLTLTKFSTTDWEKAGVTWLA